ncbi:MAG: hypothetical protein NZ932_03860 [Candidatus Bathyarchaeota archaeon]|nr:hypothetical protein [Candidatus Bathyarchaeota archaeon]MDW8022396.1 hypothetical protein [Nitrososphaerota archaeon]
MFKAFATFTLKALLIYSITILIYISLWNIILFSPIFSYLAPNFPTHQPSSTEQTVDLYTNIDVKIYRYGFLPTYWSRIGDLTFYHQTFFSLLTLTLCAVIAIKYRRLTFIQNQKSLKPNINTPTHRDEQTLKNNNKKASGLIVKVWALIGFAWFIVYQLLATLPYDVSFILVELLNYAMWIAMLASIGTLIYPHFKTLYHKIWKGGEKHE